MHHGENASSASSRPTGGINAKTTPFSNVLRILYCLFGLMTSYLVWGLLQEKIITQPYEIVDKDGDTRIEHFKDSQFLVFTNRTLAFFIALVYLFVKDQIYSSGSPVSSLSSIYQFTGPAPLFKYSFASFSNVMSAWFQYEALKVVNFPTQVLAKSCKFTIF